MCYFHMKKIEGNHFNRIQLNINYMVSRAKKIAGHIVVNNHRQVRALSISQSMARNRK